MYLVLEFDSLLSINEHHLSILLLWLLGRKEQFSEDMSNKLYDPLGINTRTCDVTCVCYMTVSLFLVIVLILLCSLQVKSKTYPTTNK
jgi:hypothetical protein